MSRIGKSALVCLGLCPALAGQVVLNFNDLVLNNYDPIPGNYGSGLHPNLAGVSYRTFTYATDATYANYLGFWNSGYGDLTNVGYPAANFYAAEVSLVPAAGYGIRLISFDMAGWPSTDRTNPIMRIIDGSGNLLFDFAAAGAVAIEGDLIGSRHTSFSPDLAFGGTLRLQWGNDWNIGLDNLAFDVIPLSAVPEPVTTVPLLALAGLLLASLLRLRRLPSGGSNPTSDQSASNNTSVP